MKKIAKVKNNIFKSIKRKQSVEGFVERFTHDVVEGWAVHKEMKPLDLLLDIQGEVFALEPQWHQRDDVADKYGFNYSSAGFTANLPDELRNKLSVEEVNARDIKISSAGVKLKFLGDVPKPNNGPLISSNVDAVLIRPQEPSDKSVLAYDADGSLLGYIYGFDNFIIQGVLWGEKDIQRIEVEIEGSRERWPTVHYPCVERDATSSNKALDCYAFEIEVPGYFWESIIKSQNNSEINLVFRDGIAPLKLELTVQLAEKWILSIQEMNEGSRKQYLSLLAIEHLCFSSLGDGISDTTIIYYQKFAKEMQLEGFLQKYRGLSFNNIRNESDPIHINTHMLWKAQRSFNAWLIENPGCICDGVINVLQNDALVGSVKKQFFKTIIPIAAKNGELLKLKQIIEFSDFYSLDRSDDNWEISLSVAPLVADRQINRACDAIWKLTSNINNGWLNTECIYFAIKHALDLESKSEITHQEAQKLRYAYKDLLESMGGEWFSRLHDELLIETMFVLLKGCHLMTDYQQLDIVKAAIKNFGLSSDFWHKIETREFELNNSLFVRAKQNWTIVADLFNNTSALATNYLTVHTALKFFDLQGNPEATYFSRELLSNVLQSADVEQSKLLEVIRESIGNDMMEAVRYAAHPLVSDETAAKLLEEYHTDILTNLRWKTERENSDFYAVQCAASKGLRTESLGDKTLESLNNWPSQFLSVDLLANQLLEHPALIESNLTHLNEWFQRVMAESNADFYLPAPVCAALGNLQRIQQNLLLENWLADIKQFVQQKFGNRHSSLLNAVDNEQTYSSLTHQGWPKDTLVVIYSCRAYLDSRINAIRETWIKDLKARDIPYVILVGDGDDSLDGDVLALDVSDTYEDLPQKTLKLFDWVYRNTQAQYVLKIDDDCYLDVDRYFDSLTYRKHHYYGRVIHRGVGSMDRTWHHSKSKTLRAQKAIDKSPEPSLYADGGGGYTLSRIAMATLIENSSTPTGERLVANSFMEDKLVGDLLAISHIMPSNEDYECYQRRRTFGTAMPVAMWENIFFSSKSTPTVVTHLDTDKDQQKASAIRNTADLWPKKIWQSCWDIEQKLNSNQLELVTEREKAFEILNQEIIVVAAMRNEKIMLPHFLKHYRDLGVKAFIISDNCSDDGTREFLHKQPDVVLYSVDTEYKHSHYGVAWQQAMLANHCLGKWALIADADELLVFPGYKETSLSEFVSEAESQGADCIRTDMIDMYPYGDLKDADFTKDSPFDVANWYDKNPLFEWRLGSGWFSNSKNWTSSLRHRLDPNAEPNGFVSQKYALIKYKPWMRFSQGIHYSSDVKLADYNASFAHFKYHAGFKEKVEDEIMRKQHYGDAKEYKRYLSMVNEVQGGFGDNQLSNLFSDQSTFKEV